eukprot:m51a1_g3793 putative glutamine-trna ligase (828) ;mRNA; r:187529-190853
MATPADWVDVENDGTFALQKCTKEVKLPYRVYGVAEKVVVAEGAVEADLAAKLPALRAAAKQFIAVGIAPNKAVETLKNAQITQIFLDLIEAAGVSAGCDKAIGTVLYSVATKLPASAARFRPMLARLVAEHKVRQANLDSVCKYLTRLGASEELNESAFFAECAVGVPASREQVRAEVAAAIAAHKAAIAEQRYAFDKVGLLKTLRAAPGLKLAEGRDIVEELDAQMLALLGPKTDADAKAIASAAKSKKGEGKKGEDKKEAEKQHGIPTARKYDHGHERNLPLPQENIQMTPEILAAHLARTGGKMITRFPPEPNGFLHIGHAKSMFLNFGLATGRNGVCYLRFDDTNPERENHQYIESIMDNVKWLGHTPATINYASSYFDRLYECAIELIKRGKAYVCHQTSEQIKESREKREPSPWRDRPIQESLELFEQMRQGRMKEGEATLRMKMDIKSENPCMWDLIAYRIKYVPHPVTGNKYCVYPSYDFTHCLNDSFEDITHSLCTLEFLPRRESYYWLLDALGMYKPVVWEFSRLNITRTVMSKRKLLTLVTKKFVHGWDDPRLPTINGLRRRGYSPAAINSFCDAVGVTTNSVVFIDYTVLEQHCRQDMEGRCTRAMGVIEPIRVELTNWPADKIEQIERPNHPMDKSKGTNTVPLTRVLYIDAADFKLEDKADFWGLAPGKTVGLRYAYPITCTEAVKDAEGRVVKLLATVDLERKNKPKGYVHWVAQPRPGVDPLTAEVRLYEPLFMSERPDEITDWQADLNPTSEVILKNVFVDETLRNAKPMTGYQFERVGFFCCDQDTTEGRLVFNRTVSLKESKEKKSL